MDMTSHGKLSGNLDGNPAPGRICRDAIASDVYSS